MRFPPSLCSHPKFRWLLCSRTTCGGADYAVSFGPRREIPITLVNLRLSPSIDLRSRENHRLAKVAPATAAGMWSTCEARPLLTRLSVAPTHAEPSLFPPSQAHPHKPSLASSQNCLSIPCTTPTKPSLTVPGNASTTAALYVYIAALLWTAPCNNQSGD